MQFSLGNVQPCTCASQGCTTDTVSTALRSLLNHSTYYSATRSYIGRYLSNQAFYQLSRVVFIVPRKSKSCDLVETMFRSPDVPWKYILRSPRRVGSPCISCLDFNISSLRQYSIGRDLKAQQSCPCYWLHDDHQCSILSCVLELQPTRRSFII
jgi:hypothetical protein